MTRKRYDLDANHPGIQLVDRMRQQGKFDEDIRNEVSRHETALQQRINGQIFGKSLPHIPTQDEIDTLRKFEVARSYIDADDLSKPSVREKVAKAQVGESPTGNRLMSANWQQMHDDNKAKKSPDVARHTSVISFGAPRQ